MYIKYEQGTIEPPVKIVRNLAKFYKVPYDFIIDDKLSVEPAVQPATYSYSKTQEEFSVADPAPAYGAATVTTSSYLQSILGMLPKLLYSEQLQLLSKLCDLVKTGTEEKKEPSKKMQAFQRILALNEELHLKSDGTKWTREELYERH